jgi:hypothetical protein
MVEALKTPNAAVEHESRQLQHLTANLQEIQIQIGVMGNA